MKRTNNFIELLQFALMGAAILSSAIPDVKAQVQDPPPERLIARLDANPGEFRNMVTSDDGQVIAVYTTGAMHLQGLPPIPSVTAQVIVIDRRQGTVELASRTPSGGFQNFSSPPGGFGGPDMGPLSISRDGRYVAFVSSATNLDPAASTPGYYTYLYDRQTQQVRVLTADEAIRPGFRGSPGVIDGSGEKLIFFCRVAAGIPIDGRPDVALCERSVISGDGRVFLAGLQSNKFSGMFEVSRDGRNVAFAYSGQILTSGDPNPDQIIQLYLVDIASSEIRLLSSAPDGAPGNGPSGGNAYFAMSDDADFVAYRTLATNISPGLGGGIKVVMKQRSTGVVRRVSSVGPLGSIAPRLAGDGRRLLFLDYGFFLPSNDIVRIYDWDTNISRAVGRPANALPTDMPCGGRLVFQMPPVDYWQRLAISGDGRTIVFASLSSNFFPGDTPDSCDLFVQSIAGSPAPQPVPGTSAWALAVLALAVLLVGGMTVRRLA